MSRGIFFARLVRDRGGAAAAELALVMPLLMVMMFGSFEMGNYFLDEHVVQKAVRDGARYAARLPLSDYAGCTASAGAVTKIQNMTRTGTSDGSGTGRLGWWPATAGGQDTVSVTVACDSSGTYSGIYSGLVNGATVVTVTAVVPYPSLFQRFGLISNATFNLNATQQAAVMGI